MNNIRLRLAPSPTGFLHLGNLRTALFGYLLAKSMGGKYILRIEDTDQKREVAGAIDSLLEILAWVGITFDEGPPTSLGTSPILGEGKYGPYIQSQRLDIYKKYADELLAKGGAYRCFCSPERLTKMREEQTANHQPPRYDRACRNLTQTEIEAKLKNNEPFVIRQSLPLDGEVKVFDELRGEISFKAADLDDHVLIKSDGMPTYQFANVVDDHLMAISHVTRGDEWLPSFPKNVLLYQAFGWETPKFIHLPLILNKTGGKLSKRQGDVYVEDYKAKGYLPEALINFCALLGWHPSVAKAMDGKPKGGISEKEIFSLSELEKIFSIKGLGSSPAIFDEEKLDYFNGYYIRQKSIKELESLAKPYLPVGHFDAVLVSGALSSTQTRLNNLSEIKEATAFFFQEPDYEADLLIWKKLSPEQVKNNLSELQAKIESLGDFSKMETKILAWLEEGDRPKGDYLWPMRVALTGLKASPGPFEVALVLGKEESLKRIKQGIGKL
jgi:glutamyl-tRNA synthetase